MWFALDEWNHDFRTSRTRALIRRHFDSLIFYIWIRKDRTWERYGTVGSIEDAKAIIETLYKLGELGEQS